MKNFLELLDRSGTDEILFMVSGERAPLVTHYSSGLLQTNTLSLWRHLVGLTSRLKMATDRNRVKHVIVDSGGFIRNAPIKDLGENIYTVPDIVKEIRDETTRARLQVLPYELHFKEPSPEAVKFVVEFSKKTGDYPSLSSVDLHVMALVYQLEKEHVGTDHIRTVPERKVTWTATTRPLESATDVAGFYLKTKGKPTHTTSESEGNDATDVSSLLDGISLRDENASDEGASQTVETELNEDTIERTDGARDANTHDNVVHIEIVGADEGSVEEKQQTESPQLGEGDVLPTGSLQESESDDDDDDDSDSDDDGWITPSNICSVKQSMGEYESSEAEMVEVGCLTTDFAMQNVLLQMGLNVVSVDGMLIRRAKSYVLRCFACFKITRNMTKEFCFHCGNKTLQKVSVTVNRDGSIEYFLSKRRPISTRGMKFSLPTPRGGKHSHNPILCEDQPEPQQRPRRKDKYHVLDPNVNAAVSPFESIDTASRAALCGVRDHKHAYRNRRNPNESKKRTGRKK